MIKSPSNIKFELTLASTIKDIYGKRVDMYILHYDNDDETGISLGVPHGREDIAKYIYEKLLK